MEDKHRVVWEAEQGQKKAFRTEAERVRREETASRNAERKARQNQAGSPGEFTGVVVEIQRGACLLLHEGQLIPCRTPRTLDRLGAGRLVVGDRVGFDLREDGHGVPRQLLPRSSKLARLRGRQLRRPAHLREEHVMAANIDLAVIVASVDLPPFHPRLVDRYLILCQYGDVTPLLCVNKIDLPVERPDLSIYQGMGVGVVFCSAATGEGIEYLRSMLAGKLSVFTGLSGVGKSSVINRLLGEELLRVGEVSEATGRGRHTTTSAALLHLGDSTYVIDMPGIRSLALWGVDPTTLRFYFPEFEVPSARCRYRDCRHVDEPGCAVTEAVERGRISEARYDSYLRLLSE